MSAQEFGPRMREARERSGYNVHSQADKAKVTVSVYKGWERGEGQPTRMQLKRMFGGGHPIMHYLPPAPDAPPSAPSSAPRAVEVSGTLTAAVEDRADAAGLFDVEPDVPDPGMPAVRAPVELSRYLDEQRALERDAAAAPLQLPPGRDHARRMTVAACASLGEAIADCRVAADLPQRELGELLGVRQGTVSLWESGKQLPIADHYDRLCDLFPELHAYLLTEDEDVRDIAKPPGNRTANQNGGRPAGALDEQPRVEPVRLDAQRPPPAPAAQDAPRAPDGLEMLASAIALANVLWPNDVPHRATVELLPAGGGWCLTVEGGDSPSIRGEGRTARLALGRVRTGLRDQIDERAAELNRELEEERRRIEARQAELRELRALVGDEERSEDR